jgi:hypothetical protein
MFMDTKEHAFETMIKANKPLSAGKIAELTNIDLKEVDEAMNKLKEECTAKSLKQYHHEQFR